MSHIPVTLRVYKACSNMAKNKKCFSPKDRSKHHNKAGFERFSKGRFVLITGHGRFYFSSWHVIGDPYGYLYDDLRRAFHGQTGHDSYTSLRWHTGHGMGELIMCTHSASSTMDVGASGRESEVLITGHGT